MKTATLRSPFSLEHQHTRKSLSAICGEAIKVLRSAPKRRREGGRRRRVASGLHPGSLGNRTASQQQKPGGGDSCLLGRWTRRGTVRFPRPLGRRGKSL